VGARGKTTTGTRTRTRIKTDARTSSGSGPDPAQDPLVAYLGAMVADRRGDGESVQMLLEPLLERGIDGYDLRVQLGLNAVRGGDFATAERHLLRAVELAPEAMQAWAMLAQLYRRSGDTQKQLHALRQAFELDPQSRRLSKDLLETAVKLQANETIAQAATMMAFIDPTDANVHALHGRALMKLGRHREAVEPLQWGLALGYQPPFELHRDLAQTFTVLGETAHTRAHQGQANPSALKSSRVPTPRAVTPQPARPSLTPIPMP
jgi:Flp pilus assembly protein TadD